MSVEISETAAREAFPAGSASAPLATSRQAMHPPSARATQPPRVMLLDMNWIQNSYVVAALSDSGIDATLLTTMRPDNIGLSHFCTQIESPRPGLPDYLPFVTQQIERIRPDVLIPLCEPILELLGELDSLCGVPIYPVMTPELRRILRDRRRLYRRAESVGIAVAPWMAVKSDADLETVAARLGYPLVLRGTGGNSGSQVRIVRSLAEAAVALTELKGISPGPPFAQAYIRGPRHMVGGFFVNGEAVRLFGQQTITQDPPGTGPSTRVRPCRDEALIRSARALFSDLGWSGMACVEFLRDDDGRFVLLEINPRPWAALEVAERSGAGICRAFAETLAGRTVAPRYHHRMDVSGVVLERFLRARRRQGLVPMLCSLSLQDWLDCLRAVPWRRPWLALYLLRRLYRELAG